MNGRYYIHVNALTEFAYFYAKKLIESLGLIEKDGVTRVSLVHYNTPEEVDKLIETFENIFSGTFRGNFSSQMPKVLDCRRTERTVSG